LLSAFTCTGYWWLPSTPESKIAGTLTYTPQEGPHLTLLGAFSPISAPFGHFPLIHGECADTPGGGALVTLESCASLASTFRSSGHDTQELSVARAYIGGLLTKPGASFSRADVQLTTLRGWLPITGLEYSRPTADHFQATYKRPEKLTVETADARLVVGFLWNMKFDGVPATAVAIDEQPSIVLYFTKPLSLPDLGDRFLLPLRNFFSLATDRLVHVVTLTLQTADLLPDAQGGEEPRFLRVYFRPLFTGDTDDTFLLPEKTLIRYEDVAENFPGILFRWCEVTSELRAVVDLYFGSSYNQGEFVNSKFLSLVQAVEAYHRLRCEQAARPDDQVFVEEVLAAAPRAHRRRLGAILKHVAKPPTFRRLMDVIDLAAKAMHPLLGADRGAYVTRLVKTRDQLSHRNVRPDPGVLEGRETVLATVALGALLQAVLLRELGFSPEQCADCIVRGWRSEAIRHHIAEGAHGSASPDQEGRSS
jgi:hypothetical protein